MVHDDRSGSQSSFPGRGAVAFAVVVGVALSGGCDMPRVPELPRIPGIYRIDIQQGNIVTPSMVDQLEIGMEKRKVRFVMGTPLVVDTFNPERWDYLFAFRPGSGPEVTQRVTVYFEDDRLVRIEDRLDENLVQEEERTQTLVKVPKQRTREGILYSLIPDFASPKDESTAEASNATPAGDAEDPDTSPSAGNTSE